MVTSVIKEIFVTANGEEFSCEVDAIEQELFDIALAKVSPAMEDYGDYTYLDVIRVILEFFTLTPKPEESPDGQT